MKSNKNLQILELFWMVLVLFLPFTSLPLASKLLRSEMVAGPSIIFLFVILILLLVLIPRDLVFDNKVFLPLFVFGCVSLLSSLLSFFLPIPIQKNFQIEKNIVEGLITLAIGVLFFFTTINLIQNEKQRLLTLRVIAYSFIPLLIWCVFQFVYGQLLGDYPDWMINFQKFFSTSGVLYKNRLTGFAYEPSWLAHQMNMFYIPIWLAASFTRQTSFKKIAKKIIIEDLFLVISVLILVLSKSRVGYISFIFMSFYLIYRFNQKLIKKISNFRIFSDKKILLKLIPIMLLVIYLFAIFLGLFFFSKFDSRMENLFNLEFYKNRTLFSIANDFVFAERILYWQTGWKIFNDYPIFGVGLGNSGFFFNDYMPSFAWALDEPRHLIFQANYQGNIKNLWFRLLSETGALGFLSFATWMLLIFFLSNRLEKGDNPSQNYWGLVGKIAIIALIIEGFSVDSFALPYYWILLGLVSSNFKDVEATIN